MSVFCLAMFWSFTHRRRKLILYLVCCEHSKSETIVLMQNIDLKFNTFLPDFDMPSAKNKVWWRYRVELPSLSISTCKITQKSCAARHVYDLFSSDLLWPDLDNDLSTYDLCTHAVTFWDVYQHFVWVDLFATLQPKM